MGIYGENPSQLVTEANNPSPESVTGSVTSKTNPSQPQKATEKILSVEEARKIVEGL
jgi:hypothetical protein